MTPELAEEFTQSLGQIGAGWWRQVAIGVRLGVPQALGLDIEAWRRDKLQLEVRLAAPERKEAVRELRSPTADGQRPLTLAETAAVVGAGTATIERDSRELRDPSPDGRRPKALPGRETPDPSPDGPRATARAEPRPQREAAAERRAAFEAAARSTTPERALLPFGTIQPGDALDFLRSLPDGVAHVCITSPPYWAKREYTGDARELGREADPERYVSQLVGVVDEIGRVLAPGAYLFLNLGDTYANEPGGYRGDPARIRGIGHLGVQAGASALAGRRLDVAEKSLVGIPWRVLLTLIRDHGWRCANVISWVKAGEARENVHDRLRQRWEPILVLTRSHHAYLNDKALQDVGTGDVWTIRVGRAGRGEGHFAPFPDELVERAIAAACPAEGVVLDPFAGSGTTLDVATRLGRRFLGCDLGTQP